MHFYQHTAASWQNPDLEVFGPVPTDGNLSQEPAPGL